MNKVELFDELMEALYMEGGNAGTYYMHEKRSKGVTYILMHLSDGRGGDQQFRLYEIRYRAMFIDEVIDKLGVPAREFNPQSWEALDVVWKVLKHYETVSFDLGG